MGGILTRYADRNLLDPERFAERAVEVLDDEGAQTEIADVIVNELEKQGAERAPTQQGRQQEHRRDHRRRGLPGGADRRAGRRKRAALAMARTT